MNLDDIKQLVGEDGGKILIVENNNVVAVVLSFEQYRAMRNNGNLSAQKSAHAEPVASFSPRPVFAQKTQETQASEQRQPFGFPKAGEAKEVRSKEAAYGRAKEEFQKEGAAAKHPISNEFPSDLAEEELTIDDLPV